jgi:hypothetical protein
VSGLPWIQVATDIRSHPKFIRLGIELQDPMAWAYVVAFWMWTAEHAGDGRIEGKGADCVIEHAAGWRGPTGALVSACVRIGLLDEISNGFAVHDWQDYAGAHIDKRDKERSRLKSYRERTRTERVRPADVHPANTDVHGETETETERETENVSEPASHPEQNPDAWLADLSQKLGAAVNKPPLKVGKRREAVIREFSRWIRIVGVDATVAECVRLAAEKGETPSYLSWWPGWLATATDADLRRSSIRPVEAM